MYYFSFIGLITLFSATVVLTFFLSLRKNRQEAGVIFLQLYALAVVIYCVGSAFEMKSPNLAHMVFWVKFQYVGLCWMPYLLCRFTFEVLGYSITRNSPVIIGLCLLSSILLIAHLTFPHHTFFYQSYTYEHYSTHSLLVSDKGILYRVFQAYHLFSVMIFLLPNLKMGFEGGPQFRKRSVLLIISILIPTIVALTYYVGLSPMNIDFIPIAFSISASLLLLANKKKLHVWPLPIASKSIVNSLEDACIVLDVKDRLVGFNHVAMSWFHQFSEQTYGKKATEVFATMTSLQPLSSTDFYNSGIWHIELLDTTGESPRYLLAKVFPVERGRGTILMISDVTEEYLLQEALQTTNDEISKLNDEKDMMIHVLAHDLRSPLFAMQTLYSFLHESCLPEYKDKLLGFSKELSSLVSRAELVLESLMFLSSTEQDSYAIEPVSLETVFDSVANKKDTLLRDNAISFILEEDVVVLAHKKLLELLLLSLCDTAFLYASKDSPIQIRGTIREHDVQCSLKCPYFPTERNTCTNEDKREHFIQVRIRSMEQICALFHSTLLIEHCIDYTTVTFFLSRFFWTGLLKESV